MKIYKVGGCIRDKLLGINSEDTDYVVIGATPQDMHKRGYVPVGNYFPVFIDNKTGSQYALARSERKNGVGYRGFEFYASPDVTLEQDLQRRDFTINAIAEDENGELIDPFHGLSDLENKIIRHISPAFTEDPLRVVRAARFRARFGFTIANETLELMHQICTSGELEHLSDERIWEEVKKALNCPKPLDFFLVLYQVGALNHILSGFKIIFENQHLYEKLKANLQLAIQDSYNNQEKFSIIIGNITLINQPRAKEILAKCKLGHDYTELAHVINQNLEHLLNPELLNNKEKILELIKTTDVARKPERFTHMHKVLHTICPQQLKVLTVIQEAASQFTKIPYHELTPLPDFINKIKEIKLQIIADLLKPTKIL